MDNTKKQAVQQISEANMLALQNGQRADSATEQFASLAQQLQAVAGQLAQSGLVDAAVLVSEAVERVNQIPAELGRVIAESDKSEAILQGLQEVTESVRSLKLDPKINVDAPRINVPPVDFQPLLTSLNELKKAQKKEDIDLSPVVSAVNEVKATLKNLSFPAPNYILPFKDVNGKAVQVQLDASGNLPTTGGGGGSGGLTNAELRATPVNTTPYSTELSTSGALTSLRDQQVAQRYTVISDSLADGLASFWTSTTANGGTATSTGGEGVLDTSASATGSAQLTSTTISYYPGQSAWFNSAVRFNDTGSAGNTRRIGVFTVSGTTPQEGFYFELSGTTLNAVVTKSGTPTAVASTSWSRFADSPFTLDTSYHSFEIRYTANRVDFYVDNVIRHTHVGTTAAITTTLNFPITIQSINTSGATSRTINVRNCGIGRFGTPLTDTSGRLVTANPSDSLTTGTIVANGGTVVAAVTPGMAGWTMGYYGTYATGASLTMEASFDGGTSYVSTRMLSGTTSTLGYVVTIAAGANGSNYFTADIPAGATHLRVRCSAWAAPTGTINVIIGQSTERYATPPGAIVLTSGTVTTLTNLTNWGNIVDNAAFTDGTTRLSPNGYIFDEVAGTALTEDDAAAARIDSKRAQVISIEDATTRGRRTTVSAGGALLTDSSATTQPVSGTVTANLAAGTNNIGDVDVLTLPVAFNTGTRSATTQRVTIATDDVVPASQSGTWTVQPGNTVNTTPWLVTPTPVTSGGLSVFSASVTTVQSVKASAGQIYGWHFFNTTAAVAYVQIFNVASGSVTLGTTAPTLVIGIPASGGATVSNPSGIAFGTAISIAATTTRSNSTTAAVDCAVFYK